MFVVVVVVVVFFFFFFLLFFVFLFRCLHNQPNSDIVYGVFSLSIGQITTTASKHSGKKSFID